MFLRLVTSLSFLCVSGFGSLGSQRHGDQQASGHLKVGDPGQPVWLSHRQGRLEDQGDQRGEKCIINPIISIIHVSLCARHPGHEHPPSTQEES